MMHTVTRYLPAGLCPVDPTITHLAPIITCSSPFEVTYPPEIPVEMVDHWRVCPASPYAS